MGPSPKGLENGDSKESQRMMMITKPCLVIFFLSLLMSIGGGTLLGWWLHKYHPSNKQLWMVPFGLILFLTPLIVWFSLIISDLCIPKSENNEEELASNNEVNHHRIVPVDDSLRKQKRLSLSCI